MITRTQADVKLLDAFFPIKQQNVYWTDKKGNYVQVPSHKSIVDVQKDRVLSVVSNQYGVVTNQMAYDLCKLAIPYIFPGKTMEDFICFNIIMPATRSSCRIDLIIPSTKQSPFGNHDEWIPFIRLSNSYNRTATFKIEIGFCRWICQNGMIFDGTSFSLEFVHSRSTMKNLEEIVKRHLENAHLKSVQDLWVAFQKKMQTLKTIAIPEQHALPVFCRAFGISIPKDSRKDLSLVKQESLGEKASTIIKAAKEYFEEIGPNAYAMMNVLTDFASFPQGITNVATSIPGYQRKAGDWVDEIIREAAKSDFSWFDYIGKDAMETADFMSSIDLKAIKAARESKTPSNKQ